MTNLDQRIHAYRADLASVALREKVEALRYVQGVRHQVSVPLANVHAAPSETAIQITQALAGETVHVFEVRDGWAWVQLNEDGYVGYVRERDLTATITTSTHRVCVASTILFPSADLKSQPVKHLTFNSTLRVAGTTGDYLELETGGFVLARHVSELSAFDPNFVSAAEQFLGTPYLWGGKGITGIDCSGLVQVALQSAGHTCLRDTDMQEATLGKSLRIDDLDGLKRGDLVFWKGHVGIMSDADTLLHANGYHMAVVKEPLRTAIARIANTGSPVSMLKRLQ